VLQCLHQEQLFFQERLFFRDPGGDIFSARRRNFSGRIFSGQPVVDDCRGIIIDPFMSIADPYYQTDSPIATSYQYHLDVKKIHFEKATNH
jgi:hypothetical protein